MIRPDRSLIVQTSNRARMKTPLDRHGEPGGRT